MNKILITGAAGFIGYHLINKLVNDFEIVGIDNINDYYDSNLKFARLEDLGIDVKMIDEGIILPSKKIINFCFTRIDITNKKSLFGLFKQQQFDLVINLAAQVGIQKSITNPDYYLQSNIVGFHNIVEACRHNNVKKLIFASSSSVYGNCQKTPCKENQTVDKPISLYAATKKSNELVGYVYSHLYNINVIGLRFFTVYGEWGRPDMAYFKFTSKILNDQPIEVYNYGNHERDFTYIGDVILAIDKIVKAPMNYSYKIYNIGNSKPINLLRIISAIEKELGKKAQIIMKGMKIGDVYSTNADTTMLEKDYGYQPSTDFETGIKKFISWYKNYYKI